jgi:hypothetical protein
MSIFEPIKILYFIVDSVIIKPIQQEYQYHKLKKQGYDMKYWNPSRALPGTAYYDFYAYDHRYDVPDEKPMSEYMLTKNPQITFF